MAAYYSHFTTHEKLESLFYSVGGTRGGDFSERSIPTMGIPYEIYKNQKQSKL